MVAFLVDPIGDRHRLHWHLKPLAEGPGEALQQGAWQSPQGAVEVLDRLGIEGGPGRSRSGLMAVASGPWPGCGPELGRRRRRENQQPVGPAVAAALHHPGPLRC